VWSFAAWVIADRAERQIPALSHRVASAESVSVAEGHEPEDLEAAFAAAAQSKAQALIALDGPLTQTNASQIIGLAAKSHLPVIYGFRDHPEDGGLMSYGPSLSGSYRHLASFVDKILRGAKPADLPIEQPTKLELVINSRTAKSLGLVIPPTLLAVADEVIE
jgi:ABC-type uncharacterized transport system substrate-binding protein